MPRPIPGETGRRSYQDAHGQWDELIVESPIKMTVDTWQAVNLRTPGQDEDLLRGYLLSEGLIQSDQEILKITYHPHLDSRESRSIDTVIAQLKNPLKKQVDRTYEIRPSCGLCGVENFSDLFSKSQQLVEKKWPAKLIQSLPEKMKKQQTLFQATGACHAAGIYTSEGNLIALGEDVGRHNAVDKAIGAAVRQKINFADGLLMLSGRCGFELIAKAARVGIGMVASVSGTTSLSLELAKQTHLTLIGFCREKSFRIYHDPGRIRDT